MKESLRKWGVLVGTGLASIIIALDFTVVMTAISTLERYFSANLPTLQWLVTGFCIPFTALLTPAGRLGDIYGRRLVFYIGIFGFGICSIFAGLAQSIEQLIIFRVLQGLFGAASFPIGMGLVASVFPKEERGRALGLYGGLLGFGLALGPFVGGIILSIASWRWLFFINIPVVLVSFIICLFFLKESKAKEKTPIDWPGLIFLIVGLSALVFGITGGPIYGWHSWQTLVSIALFVICTYLFIRSERKNPFPLIPFDLIWNKNYLVGALVFIATVSFAAPISFFAPLFLQNVMDFQPGEAGLIFLTMTAMTAIGSPLGGYLLDKKAARLVIILIFISLIISYILQLFYTVMPPLWLVILAFIFFGFSWGAGNGIGTPLAIKDIKIEKAAGTISGSLLTILNVFAVISLAVMTSVFHYGQKFELPKKLAKLNLKFSDEEQHTILTLLSEPEKAGNILKRFGADFKSVVLAFREAFMSGYHLVMAVLLVLTLVIWLVIALMMREKRASQIK